jgi:hypothetical protein
MKRICLVCFLFLLCAISPAWARGTNGLRGDHVAWARLRTPSLHWRRHAEGDSTLMQFIRDNTSLNLDPAWFEANAESLTEMCAFPLLFSQGIHEVHGYSSQTNIAEYVRRGGFLLIDACIDDGITPDPDVFLAQQIEMIGRILPEARVVALPPDHELYRCYFQIPFGRPPQTHTSYYRIVDHRWAKHGLYAIMIGARTAGIITLSGLQCGWARVGNPPEPGQDVACMKMLVNIYVYAMLQGG